MTASVQSKAAQNGANIAGGPALPQILGPEADATGHEHCRHPLRIIDAPRAEPVPNLSEIDSSLLTNNVGAALNTSQRLGTQGDQVAVLARNTFVDSMGSSLWIAGGLAFCAAIVALTLLPRHTAHVMGHERTNDAEHDERLMTSDVIAST